MLLLKELLEPEEFIIENPQRISALKLLNTKNDPCGSTAWYNVLG